MTALRDRLAAATATGSPTGTPACPLGPSDGGHLDAHLADLLAAAAEGDSAAFMHFYDHTCTAAYRLALTVTADRARAEDLTQCLYESAWRRSGRYSRSNLSPVAWLLAGALPRTAALPEVS